MVERTGRIGQVVSVEAVPSASGTKAESAQGEADGEDKGRVDGIGHIQSPCTVT